METIPGEHLMGIILFMASAIMASAGGYMDNEYDLNEACKRLKRMFDIIKYGVIRGE